MSAGYDQDVSTFSPEGRLFQVEYAAKAVEKEGTVVGLVCTDGVVLGVEKLVLSKLLVKGSNKSIQTVDMHVGIATAGFMADGIHIVNRAREEAQSWRNFYKCPITAQGMAHRLSQYKAAHTRYSNLRPFGINTLLAIYDDTTGPKLHLIEPSGASQGYYGCAFGKGKTIARTEIEKLGKITCRKAVNELVRILLLAHDEAKEKDMEIELSWISAETNYRHQQVPHELIVAAQTAAQDVDMA